MLRGALAVTRSFRILAPASLVLGVLAAACAPQVDVPESDLDLRVICEVTEVDVGAPFRITVERTYAEDYEPEPWSDDVLAPLTVREVEAVTQRANGVVRETRTFRAFAFEPGDVRVLPPLFVARDHTNGGELTATGNGLDLRVRTTLDPAAPGAIEVPPGPLSPPFPWAVLLTGVVVSCAGGVMLYARRRRPMSQDRGPEPVVAVPDPRDVALERLRELASRTPEGIDDVQRFYDEASDILRTFVVARCEWATTEMTSEELVARVRDAGRDAGSEMGRSMALLVARIDAVRFARQDPGSDGRTRFVADLRTFVGGTTAR